jgi:general secretion pathway protein E
VIDVSRAEFIEHLTRRGVTYAETANDNERNSGRIEAGVDRDWLTRTKLSPTAFADELAAFYASRRLQRTELVPDRFAGAELSPRFLKEGRFFPYADEKGALTLVVAAPLDEEARRTLEIAFGGRFAIATATAEDIDFALSIAQGAEIKAANTEFADTSATGSDELDDLRDLARGAPVVRALDDLLRLAVDQRATDLHIEPFEGALQVRLRVDGLLKNVASPPVSMAKGLLSRLKIMAGLNITERRLPQDGRARIAVGGADIDLRVATMPTTNGESAVVRLLRKGEGVVALDQIGFLARDERIFRSTLQLPFGMIIVTGPTGSGKTTTLAAALMELNQPTRKILTIEDPVEYRIPGVNQTAVHPTIGLTFAKALRSFLRQDPDVIMVGEIRDSETAHIAVHAALTGHLVLTTLHTNTAAGAITRLIDLGVESFLLSSCVKAVVGQRLVRVLCRDCKTPRRLTAQEVTRDERYGILGFQAGDVLHHHKGCEWCGFTGYRGRQGLFEVLEVSPNIRKGIGPRTDSGEVEQLAVGEGMTTMVADGVAKCRSGMTTIDEVFRVTMSL